MRSVTGPHGRHPSGPLRVIVTFAMAVIGIVGVSISWAPVPASGQSATGAKPKVTLVKQTPWVGPQGTFSLRLHVTDAPADAELSFRLHDDTSSQGRIHFLRTMRGEQLGPTVHQPYNVPIANLPTEDNVSLTASFEIDSARQPFIGFRLTAEGVYPLVVTLQTQDGRELDTFVTSLIRLPAAGRNENPPVALSIVAPVSAPVAVQTDGRSDLDPIAAKGLTDTVEILNAHKDVPLTVAAVPETVTALQRLDETSGSTVTAKLADSLTGRQVLASPYVRLNVGAWVNDNMNEELLRQLNAGTETLATTLNARPDRRTWMVDKSVTAPAMAKLRELGVDQVVVPEDMLTPLDPRTFSVTLTRSFDLDTPVPRTRAVMADGILRAHLAASDNQVLNATRLLGDLAILYMDQPQLRRGAVLMLPENGGTPKEFLDILLDALGTPVPSESGGKAVVSAMTVDRLFAFVEPAGQFGGRGATEGVTRPEPTLVRSWVADPPASLGNYRNNLALARTSLAGFRSMLGDDTSRLQPLEIRLAVSGAIQFDGPQRQAYLDAAVQFVNSQAHEIDVPEQQRVTLTSSDGQVPLVLENRLQHPVVVRVLLSSDKVDFVASDSFTATLQPGSNRIDIPVRSKSSGFFPVNVSVSSPDNVLPMSSGRLPIRSTTISGYGLVLTIGAGLFLAIWWARHFRSARRHRKLVSTDSHPVVNIDTPDKTTAAKPGATKVTAADTTDI